MRILVALDKFAGTLTAVEAADAIAVGWRRRAPDDELDLAPMSDGGPGFVDVLRAASAASLLAVTVTGPFAEPVPAGVLVVGDTAYVESAQACGVHLTGGEGGERASTVGVGELSWRRWTLGRARSSSGSAAVAPATAGPGCCTRSARPPTRPSTPARSAWPRWAPST